MKRLLFFTLLLGVLSLAGCGGGGGTSIPSPFAGSWGGTLAITGVSLTNGPASTNIVLSVDTKGTVTGTWADPPNTDNGSGALQGSVSNDGTLTLTLLTSANTGAIGKGVTNIAQSGPWQGSLIIQNGSDAGGSMVFSVSRA